MKGWKTERNRKANYDLIQYTKLTLAKYSNNDVRIYVGTDSQSLKRHPVTGYITCVAYHIGTINIDGIFYGRGVHILYKEKKVKKIKNTFHRLWKEVEMSMNVAEELRDAGLLIYKIDLDLNQDKTYQSNRCIAGATGMLTGLGYNVASKPDELFATCAADNLIHKINWSKVKLEN